jgi:hypothetical protein
MWTVYSFFSFVFLCNSWAFAKYDLPRNLTSQNQVTVAESLGFGAATKMIMDPLPLGGYDGFQIGLSQDYVNAGAIEVIGAGKASSAYISSSSFSFGKGFYYDFDTFFQMTSPQNEDFSSYGILLRRKVYSFDSYFPVSVGALVHGGLTQYSNVFGSNIIGFDIYLYSSIYNFVCSVGAGQARGIHTFVGGASGLTGSSRDIEVDLLTKHLWGGVSRHFGRWVVSVMSETYFDSIHSLKLGYNF